MTVSRELTSEYGGGFSHTEITRMIRFAPLLPDEAIVVTLSQQLSWSHFAQTCHTESKLSPLLRELPLPSQRRTPLLKNAERNLV